MGTSGSKMKIPLQSVPDNEPEHKENNLVIEKSSIDIVCYNVYCNGYDRQETIEAICNMKADILILQETNPNWERVITNNDMITDKFNFIQCINDESGYKEGGTIILTNYQIKFWDVIKKYHFCWYGAHRFVVGIERNGKETDVQIYSIHLVAPFPPHSIKQVCLCCCCCGCKICGVNKDEFRLKEIRHCLNSEFYDCKMPSLIVGDFNCMDGACHDMLQNEMGLESSWNGKKDHRLGACCRHEPFSWRGCLCRLCCFAPKLFDHIYYTPNDFELIHADVIATGDSDHYPIWARLNLLK